MAPELKTIVWMLEIISLMMTVDVDSWNLELVCQCRCDLWSLEM